MTQLTIRIFYSFFLITGICSQINGQELTEEEYQGRPHYRVSTASATYLYDRAGGGFSSIKDSHSVEWIGFKPGEGKVPGSAGADFRGLPNLVFRGSENGAGHPGFGQCNSSITGVNQITSESVSGRWKWCWTFDDQGAVLEILHTDTTRQYWFLYEGTPGGRFEPEKQFWGNNLDGERSDAPPIGSDKTANGKWDWAFFGHKEVEEVFFVAQLSADQENDTFSYMGASDAGIKSEDGMVVFGFGRRGGIPLMSGPNRFLIGFHKKIPGKKTYATLKTHIEKISDHYPQ